MISEPETIPPPLWQMPGELTTPDRMMIERRSSWSPSFPSGAILRADFRSAQLCRFDQSGGQVAPAICEERVKVHN